MHYSDEARTLNLVGGFVLGALVGAGLGLIGRPVVPARPPRRIRGMAKRVRRSAKGGARRFGPAVKAARGRGAGLAERFGRARARG